MICEYCRKGEHQKCIERGSHCTCQHRTLGLNDLVYSWQDHSMSGDRVKDMTKSGETRTSEEIGNSEAS